MASAIENSIRRALDAGASDSAAFREGVYGAAERAIERVLSPDTDPAVAAAKRQELRDAIVAVEADYSGRDADADAAEVPDDGDSADEEPSSDDHEQPVGDGPAEAETPVYEEPASPLPVGGRPGNDIADAPATERAPTGTDPQPVPDVELSKAAPSDARPAPSLGAQSRDTASTSSAPEPVLGNTDSRDRAAFEQPPRADRPRPVAPSRTPRAFAPPPPSGRDEPFEEGLDLGGVTPSRTPRDENLSPESAAVLGGLKRNEDRVLASATKGSETSKDEEWRPGAKRASTKPKKRGRFLINALILALFLFLIAIGVYLLLPFLASTASNEAPRSAAEGEASEADAAAERAWITVFTGTELGRISTPNGGRVSTASPPNGANAVLIQAPNGGSGEIGFLVGPGVVSQFAGQPVRAELTVGSPDGEEREFAVRCPFGGETRCGRQRFTVRQSSAPFIFALDLSNAGDEGGEIAIDPAIGGSQDLLVYGLRMTVGDNN